MLESAEHGQQVTQCMGEEGGAFLLATPAEAAATTAVVGPGGATAARLASALANRQGYWAASRVRLVPEFGKFPRSSTCTCRGESPGQGRPIPRKKGAKFAETTSQYPFL